jgi:hypothetical protein
VSYDGDHGFLHYDRGGHDVHDGAHDVHDVLHCLLDK